MSDLSYSRELIDAYIATGNVSEIGIGGSVASGAAGPNSDIDIYVIANGPITVAERQRIVHDIGTANPADEIPNPWWGDGDYLFIHGVPHDVMFLDDGFYRGVESVIDRHEAQEGYTTAFAYTLANMLPVHDPDGRIQGWKDRLRTYPEPLVHAIIHRNYPVMATIATSYQAQMIKAAANNDAVAVNHRTTAYLTCAFDIVFACLRQWHPGEKRQLRYLERFRDDLPAGFHDHVIALLAATAPNRLAALEPAVRQMTEDIRALIASHGTAN